MHPLLQQVADLVLGKKQQVIDWSNETDCHPTRFTVYNDKLYIDGKTYIPRCTYTKAYFDKATARLQNKLKQTSLPIRIRYLLIEHPVAMALWYNGDITAEHFRNGRQVPGFDEFEIDLNLGGLVDKVRITPTTYYIGYEFVIEGHPTIKRTRDQMDFLGLLTGEPVV